MIAITSHDDRTYALEDCRATYGRPQRQGSGRAAALQDCCVAPPPAPLRRGGVRPQPHPQLTLIELDAEYYVAFVPSHSGLAVLDHEAAALLKRLAGSYSQLSPAEDQLLVRLYGAGLLTDGSPPLPPGEPEVLTAWLHLTNACNLRCSYCYIRKSDAAMDTTTARASIDAVFRSARAGGYRGVLLKYAGGEPTMAMDLIAAAHRYAQQQADRYGLQLDAGVLSNGTLLSFAALTRLIELDLRLMVSLDSVGPAHDTQRSTGAGRGSQERVLAGIERALELGLSPEIAVTVTDRSIEELPDLVEWLLDRDLIFSLSLYREHQHGRDHERLRLDDQRLIAGLRAVFSSVARRPPAWSLLGTLLDRADLSAPHQRTCGVGAHYMVIDEQGRVAKCQMEIERPVTTVAAADPLALIRADQIGVQNLAVHTKSGCASCQWQLWCAGGCPAVTYRAYGRYDVRSPHCGVYQELFPELIRLEGQRMLYWYQQSLAELIS